MTILDCKLVDFSKCVNADPLRNRLLVFIQGRIRSRTNGVSLRQLHRTFAGTPRAYLDGVLNDLLTEMRIEIRRNGLSRRAGYVYVRAESGAGR